MQLIIELYIIKGNNTIAGIYFTNLIFLNNRFNMKVIIIAAMDIKINMKVLAYKASILSIHNPVYFYNMDMFTQTKK